MHLRHDVPVLRICERRHRQRKRRSYFPNEEYEGSNVFLPFWWDSAFLILVIVCGVGSLPTTSGFSLNFLEKFKASTSCRKGASYKHTPVCFHKLRNICVLLDRKYQEGDETMQSEIPMEPLPSSQYVQQEQLLEMVSRIGADTIASLPISERTKRAMLAEAVEDEIFVCTEQIIDLVQEQQEADFRNDSNQSASISRQKKDISNEIRDLKERNQYLQGQYNDLVSGRPSMLLNTVDSFDDSTNLGGSTGNSTGNYGENNIHDDDASYN